MKLFRNPKSEIRNPKQIQMLERQNQKAPRGIVLHLPLWILDLFRISDFGFRVCHCASPPLPCRRFRLRSAQSTLSLVVAIAGTFLIVAGLVYVMWRYTQPAPIDQARIQERKKFLTDIQAGNAEALNNYAWQDQGKGLVRLPITNAMELTIREYQNPAAARSNLAARAEKAFAPAPKAPEKPSPYE